MSFCVNGANFGPAQYYRDDEQARRVLKACRKNPVLVTGLRRIGKSWFLRRFEQILAAGSTRHFTKEGMWSERPLEAEMPRAVVILDGGAEDLAEALDEVVDRPEPDRLLAIDELEKLVADPLREHLLDRILAYRPLVLTASPVIHELARQRIPRLASFFEERCEASVLKPLSSAEKNALVRQSCDPGEGVPDELTPMALWYDWGGHPLVIQQIASLLREQHASDAASLTSAAHARLNLGGPRYGHSLSGEAGLAAAQRVVLARVASGQAPGDDHISALLQDHGAIVSRKSGWAVENCVLRRHLQGAGEALPPASPSSPSSLAKPSRPLSGPMRVFTWVHLSDLHFGAGTAGYRLDHEAVMGAIERDLAKNAPRNVDRLFVTGDIAFSAKPAEYEAAEAWLKDAAQAARVGLHQLRFVPGNHDVDRQVTQASPLLRSAHYAARKGKVELDELLAHEGSRAVLGEKLKAYQEFVARFPKHPEPLADNGIDWLEAFEASPDNHRPVRIAGLSTVWVSDELDGGKLSGDGLVPNLLLARAPILKTLSRATPQEVCLVLTHHPPSWLAPSRAQWLRDAVGRLCHIHLCGHVHDGKAGFTEQHGREGRAFAYVAGAAHSDPGEPAKHSYAWGALRYDPNEEQWQAGWAPRVYLDGEMHADATGRKLDENGFAWSPIACAWAAPVA